MEQQIYNCGMADYCLFCLEFLAAEAEAIDHEILLTTFSIAVHENEVEAKICHFCNERLISAASFKRSIEINREKFIELMKARNLKTSDVEIKQEVFPEEYQMPETSHPESVLPTLQTNLLHFSECSLCQSSGPLGFEKINQSLNCFSCPKCGRFVFTQKQLKCQLCRRTFTGMDNLQIHLQALHSPKFHCVICKMHFWSEQSRDFHGQLSHCTNCCVKNMRDTRTISFAEHEKSCVNRTTRQVLVVSVLSDESGSPPVNVIERLPVNLIVRAVPTPPEKSIVQPEKPSECSMCHKYTDKQCLPKDEHSGNNRENGLSNISFSTENGEAPPRKIRKILNVVNDTSNDVDHLDDQQQRGRSIGLQELVTSDVVLAENEFYCTCDGEDDKNSTVPTCSKCKCKKKMNASSRKKFEKFKCPLCDFKTFESSEIRLHISEQHERVNVVFQCNICSQQMPSEKLLKDHNSETHSFQCKICTSTKIFLRKEALDEHMKKHQNIKPTVPDPKNLIEII